MTYNDLRKGRVSLRGHTYVVTAVTSERRRLFDDFHVSRCAVHAVRTLDTAGHTRTLAYVVMPDHIHWLFELNGDLPLQAIVQRFKGASARQINLLRGSSGRVWQTGFHDHAVRNDESLIDTARYIVSNPLRAGLVQRIGDYSFWDSIWPMQD